MPEENGAIVSAIQGALNSISSESNTVQFSDKPFDKERYIKIDNDELADMFNISLSKIPSLAVSAANIASINQVNKIVEEGVFKVIFKNGVNDKSIADLFKNSEGLFTTVYHDSNGFNQAGLSSVGENISNKLNAAKTVNVVNGIMTVASMVVGCYYMHNIDNKLKKIDQKLDKLLNIADDKQIAKLKSIHSFLLKTIKKINMDFLNKEQLKSYHNEVVQCCRDSDEVANYYERRLEDTINNFIVSNKSSAEKMFIESLNEFQKNMNYYQYAVSIYVMSSTIETIISGNLNEKFINSQIEDIKEYTNECKGKWCDWTEKVVSWIEKTKALNPKWWEKIASSYPYLLGALPLGFADVLLPFPLSPSTFIKLIFADKAHSFIEEKVNGKSNDKRLEALKYIKKVDYDVFEDNSKTLEDYAERIKRIQNQEVGLCYYNGNVYIDKKYLETEETRFVLL